MGIVYFFFNKLIFIFFRSFFFSFYFFSEFFFFSVAFFLFSKVIDGFLLKNNSLFFYINCFSLHSFYLMLYQSSLFLITSLCDLFVVDYPGRGRNRFELTYVLLSHFLNARFFFKLFLSLFGAVPSLYFLCPSANWLERESFDFFGVRFLFHKDLRRLLTDYGFKGFPLRKDFPLMGFLEIRFDDGYRVLLAEPVLLMQKFRNYRFNNPWGLWRRYHA